MLMHGLATESDGIVMASFVVADIRLFIISPFGQVISMASDSATITGRSRSFSQ